MNEFYSTEVKINTDNAYKKMMTNLEDITIREDDFLNIYTAEEIAQDKETILEKEKSFKEKELNEELDQQKRASVLEYLIYEQGKQAGWLGKDITTVRVSRFDDIINGIDIIIEFEKEKEKYLGLAVDVSYSLNIEKKLDRIKNEIDSGELGKVKYYKSSHSGPARLTNIPRIVIACDSKTVNELTELWLEEDREKLANHPIQLQIITQIYSQLKLYEEYARYVAKNEKIAEVYKQALISVTPMLREKNLKFQGYEGRFFDTAYDRLSSGLSKFEYEIDKVKPKGSEISDKLKEFLKKREAKNKK